MERRKGQIAGVCFTHVAHKSAVYYLFTAYTERAFLPPNVKLVIFASHPRAPKKTRRTLKRTRPSKRPHVSTAKILSRK